MYDVIFGTREQMDNGTDTSLFNSNGMQGVATPNEAMTMFYNMSAELGLEQDSEGRWVEIDGDGELIVVEVCRFGEEGR